MKFSIWHGAWRTSHMLLGYRGGLKELSVHVGTIHLQSLQLDLIRTSTHKPSEITFSVPDPYPNTHEYTLSDILKDSQLSWRIKPDTGITCWTALLCINGWAKLLSPIQRVMTETRVSICITKQEFASHTMHSRNYSRCCKEHRRLTLCIRTAKPTPPNPACSQTARFCPAKNKQNSMSHRQYKPQRRRDHHGGRSQTLYNAL